MTIMVTGGGTGGHIFPALAVAAAARQAHPTARLLYVGRAGSLEERLAVANGLDFLTLPGRPVNSVSGAVQAVVTLATGIVKAASLLKREKPDVVIGTGGFVSTALCMAQGTLRKPLVILDGNVIPGRTNRLLARYSSVVCTAFDETSSYLKARRIEKTGYPVRADFNVAVQQKSARAQFGLQDDRFTVLVIGGSQGAAAINKIVEESMEKLNSIGVQVLHQVGPKNTESLYEQNGRIALPAIEDMPSAYAAADIVLTRGGISSLSEMAVVGACSTICPYPFAQANHQQANAEALVRLKAAQMVLQKDLTQDKLVDMVVTLKGNPDLRNILSRNLKSWSTPDSASRIVTLATEVSGGIS